MEKSFRQKLQRNKRLMINDWSLSYSEKKVAEVMEKKPTDKRGMVEAYAHPTYLWLTKYNIVVNWKDISAKVSCLEHALRQNDGLPSDAKDEASYMGLWLKFVINSWKMIKKILRDHNLWDVIVNGDLEKEPTPTTRETSAPPAPKTAKQLVARRNQERVKSILLLAILDEYLLKFHNVADAKSLTLGMGN
ncbi:hypothetical protein Tco_0311405 [Tanacetum coccineum]